jgi:hypothetical protein
MRAGVARGGSSSLSSAVYVSDMPIYHHMEFALNADDTAISHVPQASAAFQIPRVVSRRPRAVAKRMNSHQRLEEQCDALR